MVTWNSDDGQVTFYVNGKRFEGATKEKGGTLSAGGTLVLGQV